MSNDHELRQDVLDELDFEPSVNAEHIGVAVSAGVVTLTGFVSSYSEKLATERAVRRVRGVKAIAEELEVRLPFDKKVADDQIAARAVDILKWRVGIPASRIGVKVEKGIVTLTGDVDWRYQKSEAEAAVHTLTGVVSVVSLIRVNSTVQVYEVKEKIQKALRRSAELDASRITVRTEGGKVVLGGQVHAWFERGLAERAAWAAPGVTEVVDDIQIGA
ncbi:MAG TPA: BON domain-containing protein [Stellaceae bacterium]|nr:BON domain-containing protein [Stellaceae bacterium]